ncbi:MAG: hypothetical protein J2P54_12280 [Bradyrhizobiaceae bacterium]|nr:hypothetical protein [Bradyrhizobiaceae bacterium]
MTTGPKQLNLVAEGKPALAPAYMFAMHPGVEEQIRRLEQMAPGKKGPT